LILLGIIAVVPSECYLILRDEGMLPDRMAALATLGNLR